MAKAKRSNRVDVQKIRTLEAQVTELQREMKVLMRGSENQEPHPTMLTLAQPSLYEITERIMQFETDFSHQKRVLGGLILLLLTPEKERSGEKIEQLLKELRDEDAEVDLAFSRKYTDGEGSPRLIDAKRKLTRRLVIKRSATPPESAQTR